MQIDETHRKNLTLNKTSELDDYLYQQQTYCRNCRNERIWEHTIDRLLTLSFLNIQLNTENL
jgi:hypothetical protein